MKVHEKLMSMVMALVETLRQVNPIFDINSRLLRVALVINLVMKEGLKYLENFLSHSLEGDIELVINQSKEKSNEGVEFYSYLKT